MPKTQEKQEPTIVGVTLPSLGQSSIDPEAYRLNASQLREQLNRSLKADLVKRGRNG